MRVLTSEHALALAQGRAEERGRFLIEVRDTLRDWYDRALYLEPFESGAFCTQLRHEILGVEAELGDARARQRRYFRAIPWRRKRAVFERDNWTCQECGFRQTIAEVQKAAENARTLGSPRVSRFLTLDHIIPQSEGGHSDTANLRALCSDCNNSKGRTLPEEIAS